MKQRSRSKPKKAEASATQPAARNGNGHSAVALRQPAATAPAEVPRFSFLKPFASLKLTVTLLALAMVLIFAGTTIQSEMGIWEVQHRYFHSWVTLLEWRLFFPLWEWGNANIPGGIPFPGGYTLINLLLLNLVAAHTVRFKLSWKRSGILLIHSGLILLLLGEVITAESAVESQMIIDNGSSSNWAHDIREMEFAVTDPSPADHDNEIVIPVRRLMSGGTIQDPRLPFALRLDRVYGNSDIAGPMQTDARGESLATVGAGVGLKLFGIPKSSGTESRVDEPSAFVTPITGDGKPLGTYLTSTIALPPQFSQINQPQIVTTPDGRQYWLHLRFRRYYKPYTVHLVKFSHDRYTGTDVPKNFSSLVRLEDPANNVNREVLIWMNHPLRYAGETFYQASFKPGDQTTILQVVHNPGWLIPYVSCSMVGLGLLVHFGMLLVRFLSKPRVQANVPERPRERVSWVPAAVITGFCAIYLLGLAIPPKQSGAFDLNLFGQLPISYEGRTMPLDSLARNSLRILSGKADYPPTPPDEKTRSAIEWLADVFSQNHKALHANVFRIDHPEIKSLLGLEDSRKTFSWSELEPKLDKLQQQMELANQVDAKNRDLYQRKIMELAGQISLFNHLRGAALYLSPPLDGVATDWRPLGEVMQGVQDKKARDPGGESFVGMVQAYGENRPDDFHGIGVAYWNLLQQKMSDMTGKLELETIFNRAEPFIQCMALYVMVFVLAAMSWLLKWRGALARAALSLLVLTWLFHTAGLIARVYIQGRPPVTNLYSSAIFIAWAAVAFCVGLELIYRNGIACAAASALAFPSLLIAHYLAASGDTMQMLQAVLDTNIWLATHVVVITLGYAATFLSGFLAIVYVLGGTLTTALKAESRKNLSRMIYGVVCFAMLSSFVGTILGGIWADQSWGRFWGWDPKENGAVLIVLWNAIILHARWGGLVRDRGVALLAIVGNIVTAWSWFGTNMLSFGLHSYGRMDAAVFWLSAWVALQVGIIVVGCVPLRLWRSLQEAPGFSPS